MRDLPDYARREGDTVYVQTTYQAFNVLDYLDPVDESHVDIVISNPEDSLKVQKALKGFGLS